MSQAAVEQIIGRLVLDLEFRKQMAANREQALAGYDLTVEERAALDGLNLAELEGPASTLEERVSKGILAN
jgi:hypothetical protein